jgi:hypothetical protein
MDLELDVHEKSLDFGDAEENLAKVHRCGGE